MTAFPSPFPINGGVESMMQFFETLRTYAQTTQESIDNTNGTLVGSDDLATSSEAGLVSQSTAVADAGASSVAVAKTSADVATADASAAGVTYSQTQVQEIVDLANDVKAKYNTAEDDIGNLVTAVNQLRDDLNSAVTQLNALLAANRTSGQLGA